MTTESTETIVEDDRMRRMIVPWVESGPPAAVEPPLPEPPLPGPLGVAGLFGPLGPVAVSVPVAAAVGWSVIRAPPSLLQTRRWHLSRRGSGPGLRRQARPPS